MVMKFPTLSDKVAMARDEAEREMGAKIRRMLEGKKKKYRTSGLVFTIALVP